MLRLTGIKENTGGKTLNIKLKKNRKLGYHGNAYLGHGAKDIYSMGAALTDFSAGRMVFANLNTNNISSQFIGSENSYSGGQDGMQTVASGNVDYHDERNRRIKYTFNCGYYNVQSAILRIADRTTYLEDSSLLENRISNINLNNKIWNLNSVCEFDIDTFTKLVYRVAYNPQLAKNISADTVPFAHRKYREVI